MVVFKVGKIAGLKFLKEFATIIIINPVFPFSKADYFLYSETLGRLLLPLALGNSFHFYGE